MSWWNTCWLSYCFYNRFFLLLWAAWVLWRSPVNCRLVTGSSLTFSHWLFKTHGCPLHLGLYHTSWTKSLLDDWGLTKVTSSQFRGKTHTLNLLIEKFPAMKPCSQLPLFNLPTCRLLNSSGLGQTPVFCITQASRNISQVFWFVLLVSLGEQGDPRLWGLDSARSKRVAEDSWLSWEEFRTDTQHSGWVSQVGRFIQAKSTLSRYDRD